MIWKDLARILTHEIKNPLTPIQLTLQRLEEKHESDPEKFEEIFYESLEIIYQEVANLQNLVQSFQHLPKMSQQTQVCLIQSMQFLKSSSHTKMIII